MDPKAYFFFFYSVLGNFIGGIGVQYSLILRDLGFTVLQTTILVIPGGAAQIISLCAGGYALRKFPVCRTWPFVFFLVLTVSTPEFAGGHLHRLIHPCVSRWRVVDRTAVSIQRRASLLHLPRSYVEFTRLSRWYLSCAFLELGLNPAAMMSLSWVTSTVSGHTKKVTMNAIWLLGYGVGQMIAPQPWKAQYKPRNRVPWSILMVSWTIQVFIIIGFHFYLKRENSKRDERVAQLRAVHPPGDEKAGVNIHPDLEPYEEYSWVDVPVHGGATKRERIEKRFLDLTDKENLSFRYVL
jgi:MFS transporter, ACS family, allantoate permease